MRNMSGEFLRLGSVTTMEDVRIRASDQEYPSQCRRKLSLRSNAITFPDIIVFWQRRYSEVFTTSTNSKECWPERWCSHQRKLGGVFAHDNGGMDFYTYVQNRPTSL